MKERERVKERETIAQNSRKRFVTAQNCHKNKNVENSEIEQKLQKKNSGKPDLNKHLKNEPI